VIRDARRDVVNRVADPRQVPDHKESQVSGGN
jgi:hypothetical protein